MTNREAIQQALEALERCVATCFDAYAHEQVMSRPEHFVNQNITALRERLAQPEMNQWHGLTDEEINSVRYTRDWTAPWTDTTFARAIEAKLREKNQ